MTGTTPHKATCNVFYIDETEVTNIMYMEYLDWLEFVFPKENLDYRQIYEGALPDTLVWRNQLGYVEELTTNYLRHPRLCRISCCWGKLVTGRPNLLMAYR